MALGGTFIVMAIAIAAIWILIEEKRMKHKIFAIFLIALILFTYISFSVVLKNNDVNLKSPEGIKTGSQLYLTWIGNAFTNMKSITAYAFKQDWKQENITIENKTNNSTLKNMIPNITIEKTEEKVQEVVDEIGSIWDKL